MQPANKIFTRKEYSSLRKKLRQNAPLAEQILWKYLKNKQLLGFKFRRQFSVTNFILDFYCPALRLAIEIDGDTHCEKQFIYDIERQKSIEEKGITVIRFANQDVYRNLNGVLDEIKRVATNLSLPPP